MAKKNLKNNQTSSPPTYKYPNGLIYYVISIFKFLNKVSIFFKFVVHKINLVLMGERKLMLM
jgi:hypothetical protein